MIKLSGTLFIRAIHGRNGAFSVGRLVTEIGEFVVKDQLLDQYEEGRYEGEFGIGRIFPSSYVAQNRMVVEVRATLETLALAAIDELPAEQYEPQPEPDPIESEPALPPPPPVAKSEIGSDDAHGVQPAEVSPGEGDERLFGTLWPLSRSVKLDTTVDRTLFRQQKERLKALGYRFQPVGQTWQLPD